MTFHNNPQSASLRTLAVHAGERPDPASGASSPAIVMSTTFIAEPDATFSVEGMNEETPFIYTRWGNPTVAQLESKLAALEGAAADHPLRRLPRPPPQPDLLPSHNGPAHHLVQAHSGPRGVLPPVRR